MFRPILVLITTLILVFISIHYFEKEFSLSLFELMNWLGFILLAILTERALKYLLKYPFKLISKDLNGYSFAQGIQNIGFSAAYISFWIAVGVTPINTIVKGDYPEKFISNPLFLKIDGIFTFTTLLFTILWVLTSNVINKERK